MCGGLIFLVTVDNTRLLSEVIIHKMNVQYHDFFLVICNSLESVSESLKF